jgi:hypothetical protein
MNDPSYRIIDFGRGLNEKRGDFLKGSPQDYAGAQSRVLEQAKTERENARGLLQV